MESLPYRAEYAKSGRASCKGCKNGINKDELRMAILVQSPKFDGKMTLWYHFLCFFRKKLLTSTGDIENFQTLRYEDQQRIKDKIVGGNGEASSSASVVKKAKKTKKEATAVDESDSFNVREFSVEYAKSNRSACKCCGQNIMKNDVRISKLMYDDESAQRYGPHPGWYHVDCFVTVRNALGYAEDADQLPGFSILSNEDKKILSGKIKSTSGKKRKVSEELPAAKKVKVENKKEEKALAAQSKLIYGIRDKLKQLSKKQCSSLLEENRQGIPAGESAILDLLADVMTFGALQPCSECKNGQFEFSNGEYVCTGYMSGWTKCQNVTKVPQRKKFVVPEEFKVEEYDFLNLYKYVKRERVYPTNVAKPSIKRTVSTPRPLENFTVSLVGDFEKPYEELKTIIESLGGQVLKTVAVSATCVISSQEEVDKMSKKIKLAEKHGIHVVSEKFLEDVKNGGAALMMKQNLLSTWGGDPSVKVEELIEKFSVKSKKKSRVFATPVNSTVKVKISGPAAVIAESELVDDAQVFQQDGIVYDTVLSRCDIVTGHNSYYKMQLLKANRGTKYWVFRIWGRVGTTIGGNKCNSFHSVDQAIKEFEFQYRDKTCNCWADRNNFVKKPDGYYPLEIDYGQDIEELQSAKLKPGTNSTLPKAVQDLICLIFDVEAMKNALVEFEIDLKKMPLGKLSKKQIQKAYAVLTELQQIFEGDKNANKLLDASNRFYTLIPHDFGMKKPPLLDNEATIKSKIEMLDSLLEIEFAYNLLRGGSQEIQDPIDKHYHQLKTDMDVLEKTSEDFKRIKTYLSNTHAKTHDQYTLHLEQAFKVNRHGEYDRYKKFESLHNKKLLWHGSRITNFAGILSQGLRIAPPEAPATGYMFGKGIYFADMVSKSANYCFTSRNNNKGLLLLCEVALGDMYEKNQAEYVTKLPTNKHSTKGMGQTAPDLTEAITTGDGVEIPLGKPTPSNVWNSSLLYNEYIVYDINQVNIKYLLEVNFKYK